MIDPSTVPSMRLGDGGTIPCLGMGTFGSDRVSPEEVAGAVAGGLRVGYRLFDCAACYGNEKQIGQVFRAAFDEKIIAREDLFIMTKVWNDMHREVEKSCLQSIEDLQCAYLDMLFIHWPFPNYHPPFCDVDTRNPDSRPFSVNEFLDTYRQIEAAACEIEMHPCFQQTELYTYLKDHDILTIGYMPLGSPRRPERDIEPGDIADMQMPELLKIAQDHGVHPAIICLKWALQRGVLPIPFSVHNYEANLRATVTEKLTDEEMGVISTLERNNRLVKGQVFLWEGARDWHDLWDEDGVIVDCTDCT